MNRTQLALASLALLGSQNVLANTFFLKAEAQFADGTSAKIECAREAGSRGDGKFREVYLPSLGNKSYMYNISCVGAGKDFFGFDIKMPAGADPLAQVFPAFKGGTVESLPSYLTNKFRSGSKEMMIHSFPQLPQHFVGTPSLKITEFKAEEEGGKTFHVIAGEGSAEYDEKAIDARSKGVKGSVKWTFRSRVEYRKSPR